MSASLPLCSDFDAALLRKLARGAEICDAGSVSDVARILLIEYDWVLRFNAEGSDGLLTGKASPIQRREGQSPFNRDGGMNDYSPAAFGCDPRALGPIITFRCWDYTK